MIDRAARHLEQSLGLATRRHNQTFRRAEGRPLRQRHGEVAVHAISRHVEPARCERQRSRQRMTHLQRVLPAPGAGLGTFARERRRGGIERCKQRFFPRRVMRIEQMRRPLGHELPQRPFELRRGLIKARVWQKRTSSGLRHSVMVTRLYRNGDVWKESSRFGRDDIPLVRHVLDKAHNWIYANS